MKKTRIRPLRPATNDGLVNVVSGLGTSKGKRAHGHFQLDNMFGYQQWEAAYQTNWIARQIVDIPADDMTREWRTIKCQDADDIRAEEDRLSLQSCVNEALSWSRLYGGAAILPITNQDFEKPFRPDLIGKGGVQRLLVFDRWDLIPHSINTWDVLAENYLQPEFYTLYQGSQKIHWTHFIRFVGAKLPRRQRVLLQGWGDSELRKCLEDIKDTVSAKDGIAELMQAANVDVITRQGLSEELTTDQEDKIIERYTLFDQMKSIINTALLDGDEKLERLTLNMSGIAPVLDTFMVWISGAADIPVTRLFGRSAAGMNATGEGDLKNYYDSIRGRQTSQLDRPMAALDAVVVRSAVGHLPDDYNYDWNRLTQPNRKDEAEANKIEAEAAIILLDAGVISRSQEMRRLEAGEVYQYEDGVIEKIEATEDLSLGPVEPPKDRNGDEQFTF
jgi:phage-related protein (TIGR01555 family)